MLDAHIACVRYIIEQTLAIYRKFFTNRMFWKKICVAAWMEDPYNIFKKCLTAAIPFNEKSIYSQNSHGRECNDNLFMACCSSWANYYVLFQNHFFDILCEKWPIFEMQSQLRPTQLELHTFYILISFQEKVAPAIGDFQVWITSFFSLLILMLIQEITFSPKTKQIS